MRSLYSTFVIATLVVMSVSALLAFMLSNAYYQHFLKQQNDEKYTNITMEITEYIEGQEAIDLHEHLKFISNIGYQLKLIGEDGTTSSYGKPFRTPYIDGAIIESVLSGEVYHGIANFPRETFVTGFFANELENSIGVTFEHNRTNYALFLRPDITLHFHEMRLLFAWLLGLTIIFSLIFELILAKHLIKPLTELNEATKKIKKGEYAFSFDFHRKDEIGELASSFHDMSNQLVELDNMRNEFISNISHDIQSPLSNINGYTELLQNDGLTNGQKGEYLSIIREESDRLSSLTSQLLLLSSINQIKKLRKKEKFSIADQIRSLIIKYKWRIMDKDITIEYTLPDVIYSGDPALLLSVWDNLLSNAVKYNKSGGSISIDIKEEQNYINIIFRDSGVGISSTHQKSIFERFYRVDASRTKEINGTGLGLAIVEKVVALHGGSVLVDSEKDVGSTFIIRLPLTKV
ncbi:HAMP domain-containing sensor histidine kinase (plasmid) [Alkalihalophilus pseudofirmus]|uniref:HAMP domain-containing sensor histidine kinase n=1 Tax=Alkalihalophilus pseudofirmus TaxID=79885 RepID=UPI00259B4DF6|nr:HAMP domain-containing sensor histidine kinase [Alkalihalophilus pseudofirmus]WEG19175.1 HAMP domain-containing sensor histidine kinase [Alkalihalophilus pseudofirmus]